MAEEMIDNVTPQPSATPVRPLHQPGSSNAIRDLKRWFPWLTALLLGLSTWWVADHLGLGWVGGVVFGLISLVLGNALSRDRSRWEGVFLAASTVVILYAVLVLALFTRSHFTSDAAIGYGDYLAPTLIVFVLLAVRRTYRAGKFFTWTVFPNHARAESLQLHSEHFQVPDLETLILAALAANVVYLGFTLVPDPEVAGWSWLAVVKEKFVERGPIPVVTAWLFCWAIIILFLKLKRIRREEAAERTVLQRLPGLQTGRIPERAQIARLLETGIGRYASCILPRRLRAIAVVGAHQAAASSVADALTTQATLERNLIASSHTSLRFIIWAIPVLGFLGTVWGISISVSDLTGVLAAAESVAAGAPSTGFGDALGGLGIAFDTTVLALSLSVVAMLFASYVRKMEDDQVTEAEILLQQFH